MIATTAIKNILHTDKHKTRRARRRKRGRLTRRRQGRRKRRGGGGKDNIGKQKSETSR